MGCRDQNSDTACSLARPEQMTIEGTQPSYRSPLPEDNFKAAFPAFPSLQKFADAIYRIYDSEIGYIAHRQFVMWGDELQAAFLRIVTDPTKQLCDIPETAGNT